MIAQEGERVEGKIHGKWVPGRVELSYTEHRVKYYQLRLDDNTISISLAEKFLRPVVLLRSTDIETWKPMLRTHTDHS